MSRIIFEITGKDRVDFLQNLVTNDLNAGPLVYTALLSPQGKYLADFFLVIRPELILLDVDEALADALVRRLTMYRLRADVQIDPSPLHLSRGTGPAPDGALQDPRHAALGWRLYADRALPDDDTDWAALRVAHAIPAPVSELIPDDSYILEHGFERLHGVDFRKGCYVGQEVTARMKHKTELRKGLARVSIDGNASPGDAIEADGKPVGYLGTISGGQALAYLRFDRASGEMTSGEAKITQLSDG